MKTVENMKQLINKLGERTILSLFLVLCLTCLFVGCSDDNDDQQYITDTHLSLLQNSQTSLSYLLKNSVYGTTPGTFPEEGKDILIQAIAELDAFIARLNAGEKTDDATVEAAIAKANQAIDAFKETRLYNLSETARQFIKKLQEKIADFEEICNDETKWGNHKGQYPMDSKKILERAIDNLNGMIENIQSGAISNMNQELFDEAIQVADESMQKVEDTKWEEDHLTWNLFVDGNRGGYIDFGYSEDYVKFGEENHQNFMIELWVNIKEYCSKNGEDNSTFLSAFVNEGTKSGWRVQYRKVNGGNEHWLRGSMAHWQNEGPRDPEWWEPRAIVSEPKDKWTHFVFAVADDGVPGFDAPQEHTKSCVFVNGSQTGEVIRVGEPWRTYIHQGCVDNKMPMTAFCRLNLDKTTREEYVSGYIKYIRIWKTMRSRDEIRHSAQGNSEVDPADPNLVAAWDFETLGSQPTGTAIKDITGRHIATLKGACKWVENTTIKQ